MNYHLNRNGQNLGIFSLEELKRRRATGELTGSELVWTQGMVTWQILNSILPPATPGPIAPVSSNPRQSNKLLAGVLVVAGLILAGIIAIGSIVFLAAIKQLQGKSSGNTGGIFGQSAAMVAACEPVVVNSNSVTKADIEKSEREFWTRQFLDGYRLRGNRNPECDALAQGLISNWIATEHGGVVNSNLPSLAQMSDQLANDPNCTDPLVLTVAAVNQVELHQAISILQRAVNAFPNSRHLGWPEFYAIETLADKLIDDQHDRQPALDAQGLLYLKAAFSDGSLHPDDQAQIADIFVYGQGKDFFVRDPLPVYTLIQSQGGQYRWLALVLQGEDQINKAWDARGDGWSDSVSSSGWEGFRSHLAQARNDFYEAWKLEPHLALASARMETVCLGDSDITEMRCWFDRAVAAQFDDADAWKEMLWGLRPRWDGTTDSMLAFGITALNTRRFDTQVPQNFFNAVIDVEQELDVPGEEHIYDRKDIWPHLKEMYEGYIANPSQDDSSREGWRSSYTVVAYLAGHYDVARQQLQALKWQPDPLDITGWSQDLSLMALEVAARTGPQSPAIERAEDYRQDGNLTKALDLYDQLAAETNLDRLTRSFIQERQYSLATERQLQTGKWIPFLPEDDRYIGWQTNLGTYKILPDGSLAVHSDENGHMLYSRARVGMEFEVRGVFDVIDTTSNAFQAGLVMGVPQFDGDDWYAFRVKRSHWDGDTASFSQHWKRKQVLTPLSNLDSRTNSFDFQFLDGHVTATVNGREVFHEIAPPADAYVTTNEFMVGLGAFNNSDATDIRYHDVQIRSLAKK